jgi:maltose O-acetyltransferase
LAKKEKVVMKLKTEKERMLAGKPYNARDPQLLALAHRARDLLAAYTATPSAETAKKQEVLSSLLRGIGRNVCIEAPFFCNYGENIFIGNNVFVNYNCVFLDSNLITFGDNILIGPAVQIYTATHPINAEERFHPSDGDPESTQYITQALPVGIGSNVWLGGGTILMPGVQIGENSTIGAGAVVTESVPPNVFAAGNPCRIIRELK